MCFSAPASFIASGIIGATGIATLKNVKHKYEIPFAAIPLIFALHQLMEGIIWISYDGGSPVFLTNYFYLFIAIAFWPLYFPIAIFLLEKKENLIRRKILYILIALGAVISIISTWSMFLSPISVSVVCNSLYYGTGLQPFPWYLIRLVQIFYIIVGIGCMFVSSHKFVHFFGAMLATSFLITYIFYYQIYFSVWCFFAAIMSISIYYFYRTKKQRLEV